MPETTGTRANVARKRKIDIELESRDREALSIYRPQPNQQRFHESYAMERILFGGKRSGKSLGCFMDFGAIVTGRAIIAPNGQSIYQSRPSPTKRHPRIYWLIGWDVAHIGQTLHKNLFQSGMGGTLYAIRDKITGKYRTYNRSDPHDVSRQREAVMAGPIIPPRMIVPNSWTWNQQGGGEKANSFSSVELINGAKIFAFPSSQRQAKAGDAVSGIMIDEDIQNPEHFSEWQDRLGDENGWLIWSVWPRIKNTALMNLIERANEEAEQQPDRRLRKIEQFQLVFSQNQYMTKEAIENQLSRMEDEDARARRDRGELMLDTLSMYDFDKGVHCIAKATTPEHRTRLLSETSTSALQHIIKCYNTDLKFPTTWTRYLSIDPSNTRTAVHSVVVPPAESDGVFLGNVMIVEWELVVKKYSAKKLAEALKPLMQGFWYEEFIMDKQMGRQTQVGLDKTVFENYEIAFKEHGLTSHRTGSNFTPACNVPATRYRAVREALSLGPRGCPGLLLCEETTIETQREFNNYRKKQMAAGGDTIIMDEPANPRKFDCMASVEYGATHIMQLFTMGIAYVPPNAHQVSTSSAWRLAQRLKAEANGQHGAGNFVNFGPGSGSARNTPPIFY